MTQEELDRLQEQLFNEAITIPEEEEALISDTAKHVASTLVFHPNGTAKAEFLEDRFIFKYRKFIKGFKECLTLLVANEAEINPMTNSPRLTMVEVEINNTFSLKENLEATVESFLRHRLGHADVGEIE